MVKKLMGSIRDNKRATILTPVFVALEVLCECILPFIMSYLIDGVENGDMQAVLIYSAVLLVLAVLSLLFGIVSSKMSAKASAGFAQNLRGDMFNKIQDFSFENIDKFSSASLVTRMTTDVSNVQNAFSMIIRVVVRVPLMIIFSIVMAFILNVQLAWVFVILLPILGCILLLIIKGVSKIFNVVFKKYDKLNNSVQENVKGIRVVKTYCNEEYETRKFNKAADEVCEGFVSAEKRMAWNSPVLQFFIYLAVIAACVCGTLLITQVWNIPTDLTTGKLSSLLTYGMQILVQLMMLSMVLIMISMSVASARRIAEVLDEDSTVKAPENAVSEVKDGSVTFDNVCFRYEKSSDKNVLDHISFALRSGQTLGILGATGSAKSTLVNLISRLYDVTDGSVKVGGVDVREYDLDVLRSNVSVVLQKNTLFSGTIKENLLWGNEFATDEEIVAACKAAQAHEFIMGLPDGYDSAVEQGGSNFSGGQKQRLCIARALLKNPKILILDDSTSAVDTKTDALIRHALQTEKPYLTKIIISQRVSSIEEADQILYLDSGKIIAMGSDSELYAHCAQYRELKSLQNKNSGGNGNE